MMAQCGGGGIHIHTHTQTNIAIYKNLLTSKIIISKLCFKNVKKKNDPRFLKGFGDKMYISDLGISCV